MSPITSPENRPDYITRVIIQNGVMAHGIGEKITYLEIIKESGIRGVR